MRLISNHTLELPETQQRGRRPHRVLALGAALALFLFAGCADDGAVDEGAVTLATSANSMTAVPVLAALGLDTFADHDLQVEEVPMNGSSANALAALLSGETDFAFLGGTSVVDARAEGANIVILAPVATNLLTLGMSTDAIAALAEEGITKESDISDRVRGLQGLTVATSPPGSLSHTLLFGLLDLYGVPHNEVQIVPSDPGAMLAGIDQGLYDAVFWPVGVMEQAYTEEGDAELWISFPRGDVPKMPQYMQGVVATTEQVMEESPDTVEAFRAALLDATATMTENEGAAKEAVKQYAFEAVPQEVFDQQWSVAEQAWLPDLAVSEELFQSHMEVQGLTGDGDYGDITYDELIAESAQTS